MNAIDRRISVAPMMDWTDRHCRYFLRGFSTSALLYTEMITASAVLRGDRERLLRFHVEEHPVALQLGGSDPHSLAQAARVGAAAGYDEINLNCGCPSDRVQRGTFGACLMDQPAIVADCVAAICDAVDVPVTVKMRIGVVHHDGSDAREAAARFDQQDFDHLCGFVEATTRAGSAASIVHARKAVLGAWSPRDNREIPPLRYDVVRRLKQQFAHLPIILNGGLRDVASVRDALGWCDGVMLGREAYHRPMLLAEVEASDTPYSTSMAALVIARVLGRMADYAELEIACGERLSSITRHMLGLLSHRAGAREFRRLLSEGARLPHAGPELIRQAARLAAHGLEPTAAGPIAAERSHSGDRISGVY